MFKSLKAKLIAFGVFIAVVAIAVVSFILVRISLNNLEEVSLKQSAVIVDAVVFDVEELANANRFVAMSLASDRDMVKGLDLANTVDLRVGIYTLEPVIKDVADRFKDEHIDTFCVFDKKGNPILFYHDGKKIEVKHFVEHHAVAYSFLKDVLGNKNGKATVLAGKEGLEAVACQPVFKGSEIVGYVLVDSVVADEQLDSYKKKFKVNLSVFTADGKRVATTVIVDGKRTKAPFPSKYKKLVLEEGKRTMFATEFAGKIKFVSLIPLQYKGHILGAVGVGVPGDVYVQSKSQLISRSVYIGIVGVILAVLLALFVSKTIIKDILKLRESIFSLAKGDLTFGLSESPKQDEVGQTMQALDEAKRSLSDLVLEIKRGFESVKETASSLVDISDNFKGMLDGQSVDVMALRSEMESTASAAEQTNAGVEEVASSAQSAVDTASKMEQQAKVVVSSAEEGASYVRQTTQAVEKVAESMKKVVEAVEKLSSSLSRIEDMALAITNIADQTNLLALNAAIEAARAGEAGKGFAVVAEEVRKLAEESNKTAIEIGQIAKETVKETTSVTQVIKETEDEVRRTSELAEATHEKIMGVLENIAEVGDGINDIVQLIENQSAASQEIASAMDSVANSVREVALRVDKITDAINKQKEMTEVLSEMAVKLSRASEMVDSMIKKFKVGEVKQRQSSGLKPVE